MENISHFEPQKHEGVWFRWFSFWIRWFLVEAAVDGLKGVSWGLKVLEFMVVVVIRMNFLENKKGPYVQVEEEKSCIYICWLYSFA